MEIRIGKEAPLQDSTGHGLLTAVPSPKRGRTGTVLDFLLGGIIPGPSLVFKSVPAYLRTKLCFRPRTAARCAHWPGRG